MKRSPKPTAMASAWTTSASASARRPAPSARAIADEIPPPMAPADIICISMSTGKTSATPASASVPSLPTKYVSMSPTDACTNMTSTLGVASRRSVLTMGPSSSTRVRASKRGAVAGGAVLRASIAFRTAGSVSRDSSRGVSVTAARPYRATPISSGSCPSATSATSAIRWRWSTLAKACAFSGTSRRKEKNRSYAGAPLRSVTGSRSRVHDVLQHGLGRRTDDPVDDRALLEEQDRRDRLDPVASRQPVILVDVDLHQRHPSFKGQFLEDRRDRPARAAPLSPEVDHHEALGRDQRLIEVPLGQVDRLGQSVISTQTHLAGPPMH